MSFLLTDCGIAFIGIYIMSTLIYIKLNSVLFCITKNSHMYLGTIHHKSNAKNNSGIFDMVKIATNFVVILIEDICTPAFIYNKWVTFQNSMLWQSLGCLVILILYVCAI